MLPVCIVSLSERQSWGVSQSICSTSNGRPKWSESDGHSNFDRRQLSPHVRNRTRTQRMVSLVFNPFHGFEYPVPGTPAAAPRHFQKLWVTNGRYFAAPALDLSIRKAVVQVLDDECRLRSPCLQFGCDLPCGEPTPASCKQQKFRVCLEGLRRCVDLAMALHLGTTLSLWTGFMGLMLNSPPVAHAAYNGLPTALDSDALNADSLLAAVP